MLEELIVNIAFSHLSLIISSTASLALSSPCFVSTGDMQCQIMCANEQRFRREVMHKYIDSCQNWASGGWKTEGKSWKTEQTDIIGLTPILGVFCKPYSFGIICRDLPFAAQTSLPST